jgi:hypothetical protein
MRKMIVGLLMTVALPAIAGEGKGGKFQVEVGLGRPTWSSTFLNPASEDSPASASGYRFQPNKLEGGVNWQVSNKLALEVQGSSTAKHDDLRWTQDDDSYKSSWSQDNARRQEFVLAGRFQVRKHWSATTGVVRLAEKVRLNHDPVDQFDENDNYIGTFKEDARSETSHTGFQVGAQYNGSICEHIGLEVAGLVYPWLHEHDLYWVNQRYLQGGEDLGPPTQYQGSTHSWGYGVRVGVSKRLVGRTSLQVRWQYRQIRTRVGDVIFQNVTGDPSPPRHDVFKGWTVAVSRRF